MAKLPTVAEYNKQYQVDNPQFFGSTTSNADTMAKNRASLVANSGGTLREVNGNVVPVLSSTSGVGAINNAVRDQANDVTRLNPQPTTKKEPVKASAKNPALENIGAVTADEANSAGVDLNNYTYDNASNYYIPKSKTAAGQLEQQYEADKSEITKAFSSRLAEFDAASREVVNSIKGIYSSRIQAQQEANKRSLQRYNTLGIRGGSGRYAPEIQNSILTGEEKEGLKRIESIAAEEAAALARAQQNLTDKKYEAFIDERNQVNDLRKERQQKLDKQLELATKRNEEIKKQEMQAQRDSVIANLVEQGVKSPTEIMALLTESARASGYNSSDFTLKEIDTALKVLTPDASLSGLNADYKTYKYLTDIKDPAVKGLTYFQYLDAVATAQRKPTTEKSDVISLTPEKKVKLLGAGLNEADIANIEQDVRTYGLQKVIDGLTDEKQKSAIEAVYGAGEAGTKLTRESIAKLYGLTDDEEQSSILGFEYGDTNKEKITTIMDAVERYKAVGYSDKEILKLIQE